MIDRRDRFERITAIDENSRVARESRWLTRDGDDGGHVAGRQALGLSACAGARRIEHHGIEFGEFGGLQRTREQIAGLAGNAR